MNFKMQWFSVMNLTNLSLYDIIFNDSLGLLWGK